MFVLQLHSVDMMAFNMLDFRKLLSDNQCLINTDGRSFDYLRGLKLAIFLSPTLYLCRSPTSPGKSRRMAYRRRSRTRSRSPRRYRAKYSHSRSRSYSPRGAPGRGSSSRYYGGYSDRRKEFYRSHSRSPMSNRRRHVGNRVSVFA